MPKRHIPEAVHKKAEHVLSVIRELSLLPRVSEKVAEEAGRQIGCAPRTVRHHIRRYNENPTIEPFLPKRYRQGCTQARKRLPDETEDILQWHLEEYHIRRDENYPIPAILEMINRACRLASTKEISESTLYRRLHGLPQKLKNQSRRKKTGVEPKSPKPGRLNCDRPLENIQIDHTMVDAMLDLRPYDLGIRRPWLTLAIDMATRAIYGYYLSLIRPNANACALTVMMGFAPRTVLLNRLGISLDPFIDKGIAEPWPKGGMCSHVRYDNAFEFIKGRFPEGLAYLGIKGVPRPLGRKHYGGHIERLIGRFMQDVHMLPGTTFSNTVERDDYPSEQKACMTIEEFEVWLVLNILRYHMTVHHGLGCSPYDKYRLLRETYPEPLAPQPTIVEAQRAFLRRTPRRIHEFGILHKHRHYYCHELDQFVGARVNMGWQDNDLHRIFISLDNTFDHLEVPLLAHQPKCRYLELWDKTYPRKGRVLEDKRQTDLAADLLSAQIELSDNAFKRRYCSNRHGHKALRPVSHIPKRAPLSNEVQSLTCHRRNSGLLLPRLAPPTGERDRD